MDRLRSMRIFSRVAELGSFTKAADEVGLSAAMVSRSVAELEAHLGVQLLHRSTRQVALTERGQAYLTRCRAILEEIDDTETQLAAHAAEPVGRLRVHAPVSFALHCIGPYLAEFGSRYPLISVDLTLGERAADIINDGYDIVILGARRGFDASLTARKLLSSEIVLCASPGYLQQHPTPQHPRELAAHRLLDVRHEISRGPWQLKGPGGELDVRPLRQGQFNSNNAELIHQLALAGAGIAPLPGYIVDRDLAAGRLLPVLDKWRLQRLDVYAALPSRRFILPKVKTFLDFLSARLVKEPL